MAQNVDNGLIRVGGPEPEPAHAGYAFVLLLPNGEVACAISRRRMTPATGSQKSSTPPVVQPMRSHGLLESATNMPAPKPVAVARAGSSE
jgi:hypothetical protein